MERGANDIFATNLEEKLKTKSYGRPAAPRMSRARTPGDLEKSPKYNYFEYFETFIAYTCSTFMFLTARMLNNRYEIVFVLVIV